MDQTQQVNVSQGPSFKLRCIGVVTVMGIYAAQFLALDAIRIPLQQSVLLVIVAPIILGVGWLAAGFILGGTVISRSSGGWRFAYGLAVALFLSFLLVLGFLRFINHLPR